MTQPPDDRYTVLANPSGLRLRQGYNDSIIAMLSDNFGPTEPFQRFGGMDWIDTSISPPVWKKRNIPNTQWHDVAVLDPDNGLQFMVGGSQVPSLTQAQTFLQPQEIRVTGSAGELSIGSNQSTIVGRLSLFQSTGTTSSIVGAVMTCRRSGSNFVYGISVRDGGSLSEIMSIGDNASGNNVEVSGSLNAGTLRQNGQTLDGVIGNRIQSLDAGTTSINGSSVTFGSQSQAGRGYVKTSSGTTTIRVDAGMRQWSYILVVNDSNGAGNILFTAGNGGLSFRNSSVNLRGVSGQSPQCALVWVTSTRVNIRGDNT